MPHNHQANGSVNHFKSSDNDHDHDDAYTSLLIEDPQPVTNNGCSRSPPNYITTRFPPARIRDPRIRMVLMLAFLLLATSTSSAAVAIIHDYLPYSQPPLPDIWFSLFAENAILFSVAESVSLCGVLCALIVMCLHPQRCTLVSRIAYIAAMLYFGRAITMSVTLVPVTPKDLYCAPHSNTTNVLTILRRLTSLTLGMGTEISGGRQTCGDYIYSGHTMATVLSALTVAEYATGRVRPVLLVVSRAITVFVIFSILTSRFHYSIDVVLGYFLTTRLFYTYHNYVEQHYPPGSNNTGDGTTLVETHAIHKQRTRGDWISRIIFFPFVHFIERG